MGEKIRLTLFAMLLVCLAIIIQSTLFTLFSIGGIHPDIALIILVFVSYRKGHMTGQITGFFAGFIEDIISLSPLGFHSLVKTFIGFLYGYIQGRIVIDMIVIPILFVTVATIIKILSAWIMSLIFSIPEVHISFFHLNTLIEILYNAFLAPFIFALLNRFKSFRAGEKEII
ncbi:MAG: rod shape-determining protein MreD [Spirochaetales bacterium]|nr:rod shape-determining protein MreD [Spirochaetales bacterium]